MVAVASGQATESECSAFAQAYLESEEAVSPSLYTSAGCDSSTDNFLVCRLEGVPGSCSSVKDCALIATPVTSEVGCFYGGATESCCVVAYRSNCDTSGTCFQPVSSCSQFCSDTTSRFAEDSGAPSSGGGGSGRGGDGGSGLGTSSSLLGGSDSSVEGAPASDDNTGAIVGATLAVLAAVAAAIAVAVYCCCRRKGKQCHGAGGMGVRSSVTQRP